MENFDNIEDFKKNMNALKYKKGDKVRIKSLNWYNENKNKYGVVLIENGEYMFHGTDTEWCNKIVTIRSVHLSEYYLIEEDGGKYRWTDEMIEGLVEEEKPLCEGCCGLELKFDKLTIADNICSDKVEIVLQDYELKQEGDKWFAVKKKKEYPKTYDECAKLLNTYYGSIVGGYNWKLLSHFQQLLICRGAYWKMAGEEMGLDKPWEPDWNHNTEKYVIYPFQYLYSIDKENYRNTILAFPTEEIRDTFYENFKNLIEQCKELL